MELLAGAFLFMLGASVGSFLNVVILRFGYTEARASRSHCAQCNSQLTAADLVPLLSYLWLSGHCRRCGSRLSAQYPLVEVGTGLVFVASYVVVQDPFLFLASAGFWTAMMGLVVYDIRHTLVPLPFVYALFGFALLRILTDALSLASFAPVSDAFVGALVCGGFFAFITLLTRGRGMGIGDAYIAAAIGAMFGLEVGVVSGVFAVWIGAVTGILLIFFQAAFKQLRKSAGLKRVTLKTEIPFAPFLALGALVAFTTGLAPVVLGAVGISL